MNLRQDIAPFWVDPAGSSEAVVSGMLLSALVVFLPEVVLT